MSGWPSSTPAILPMTNGRAAIRPPKAVLIHDTVGLCVQVYKDRLRAVVLTGSLARDEGTFVVAPEGDALLGDAEFFVVFHERNPLPSNTDLKLIVGHIEERLCRRRLQATVSLDAVHPRYFRDIQPSIFGYELRECGGVAWGDPTMLTLIPPFGRRDIPPEDAWRLLANRLVEQLEGFDELAAGRPTLSPGLYYRTVKLYLDMATSFLIFAGAYAPSYRERAENLGLLAATGPVGADWPLPLAQFSADVSRMTHWKLSAVEPPLAGARALWERAIEYAEALWEWELRRLAGVPGQSSREPLMRAWMKRQPLPHRLRGWLYVARRLGWLRSSSNWHRWARHVFRGSPRYLVYAAASELLFHLPVASPRNRESLLDLPELARLRNALPVRSGTLAENGGFGNTFVSDILTNYHDFLTETRA